jgi:hypothetical protein
MIVATISTAACLADPVTNRITTGQQIFDGYLHTADQVVASNMSLSDVTGVFGFGGGASTANPKFFTMTPAFWKSDGDAREVQMQLFEPPYIKMVNVRLEQSGADIVARATTAGYYRWDDAAASQDAPHYAKAATPGIYDFFCGDNASHSAGVAESASSAGYGVHHFGVYSGSRAKTTLGAIENGCVYNIADGGTLEMKGTSDFAGWIDGNGELKIGDSADPWTSDSISELQLNTAQTVFEKANVHSVTMAVHSVYGTAVGGNISRITVCNSKYESATQRLLQVHFMDGATLKAILLRLTQNGDRVDVVNYNWKYDRDNVYKIGDDATDWPNGGQYLIQSATLYAPATHMTVATTNLAHGAFTVDGAYAKVTSRYTINQGGALSVRNGGYLDVEFSDSEKTPNGSDFNLYGGFGGSNDGGYALLRVLDGSTMFLRGLSVSNKSSLEVSGGSTLALVGNATRYTYVPYFKLADGSQVVTPASYPNALRMGYVAGVCKLWSAGAGCTNVIDSDFTFVNQSANNRTLHVIADADLVFKKNLLRDSGNDAFIYKYGPAAVEIQGENTINGTMFLQEGCLRVANDKGLTNNVSFAGGTLEVVSNKSVKVGMLTLASRTLPDAAAGGRIVLQPTASLEFTDVGDFAEGAELIIEGDLSGNVLKMPPLGVSRLRAIRLQTEGGLKRVGQDEDGYLHESYGGMMIMFR